MAVIYRCPQCRNKFKWDILKGDPQDCAADPPCGYTYRDSPDDVIVMPSFLSPKSKNIDATARQLMDASEHRAYEAAAMAGVPASEMSDLKLTNFNDDKGSQYNVPDVKVSPEMAQAMANPQVQQQLLHNQNAGLAYSSAVSTGPHANAGTRMQKQLREMHPQMVRQQMPVMNKGGFAPSTDVMSERPDMSLFSAGYRRRI
jgi:hypothetical protein